MGVFAGFVFYINSSAGNNGPSFTIEKGATVTWNGIAYLIGAKFLIQDASSLTINPGSLVADFIEGDDSSTMSLTGTLNTSSSAQIAMEKQGSSGNEPVLVH